MRAAQQTWRERLDRAVAACEKQAQQDKVAFAYPNPPAAPNKILEIEKSIGFRLETGHKEFLMAAGGWNDAFLSW